jgi:uncharacterized protein (DUF2062 family)
MAAWIRRRLTDPILLLLHQGITPEKIALSIVLGLTLGVVPMLGTTSLLCFAAALALRLNQPAIQLINYLVYPLQLALLVPLLQLGERVFGEPSRGLTLNGILDMVKATPWHAVTSLWTATMHALVVWLVLAAVTGLLLYPVLIFILRRTVRRTQEVTV